MMFRRHLFDLPATKSIESVVALSLRAPHEVGFVPRCSYLEAGGHHAPAQVSTFHSIAHGQTS